RDLDPPVRQWHDRDVLVLLEILERLGRQVFYALQLACFQAGHTSTRLGYDPEHHGIEAGLLESSKTGALLIFRVRRIAVIALQLHLTARREIDELPRPGADDPQLHCGIVLHFRGYDDNRNRER